MEDNKKITIIYSRFTKTQMEMIKEFDNGRRKFTLYALDD